MDHEKHLHGIARDLAENLIDPDKKQLRFNEIVSAALDFYPQYPIDGVRELVASCDRSNPALYVSKRPMWSTLRHEYGWMMCA